MARSAVLRKASMRDLREEIRRRFPHALFERSSLAALPRPADGASQAPAPPDSLLPPEAAPETPGGERGAAGGAEPRALWRALLPEGRLERGMHLLIRGGPSSGKTSLAVALMAQATARHERVAYVDLPGTFYPPAAAWAGVALEGLLLVRPRVWRDALRAAQVLLDCGGFSMVVLDLGAAREGEACEARPLGGREGGGGAMDPLCRRLLLALRGAGGALVVLAEEDRPLAIAPMVTLGIEAARPLWQGRRRVRGGRLQGLCVSARSRDRAGGAGPRVEVVFGGGGPQGRPLPSSGRG